VAATGWKRRFDEPISLPDGRKLVTLRDAGEYIAALPARLHDAPEWQTATEMLLNAPERGGIVMFAQIATLRALHDGKPKSTPAPRRKAAKKYKVLR
jgi:hypothetical protein